MERNTAERVVVITGASSGIGLAAAKAFASQGWRIIAHGRNAERCEAAREAIAAAAGPRIRVDMLRADLSLVAEAVRAAEEIAALTDHIDVLLNNAGGVASARKVTAEGNEATFAGNHLGHFVLTKRLLPLLRRAAAGSAPGSTRIINVASSAHEFTAGLEWDDLQSLEDFEPNQAYCRAKLANVMFTKALARRLSDSGIVVHAMHPGAVDTRFFSYGDADMQEFARTSSLVSAEQAADTAVWLASAPEPGASSGLYWHERKPIPASDAANDPASAERLWEASERLAGAAAEPC